MFHLETLLHAKNHECVILKLRRHWTTLIPLGISMAVLIMLPFLAFFSAQYARPDFFDDPVHTTLFILAASLVFLYGWLFLYQHYLDYYLDLWIVTNERVLNIEQNGLFARTVSELHLHRVQDVTAEVHGFIETMFDYGTVHIQTAGEVQRFRFEQVAHPNKVSKIILDLAETARRSDLEEAVEEFRMPQQD